MKSAFFNRLAMATLLTITSASAVLASPQAPAIAPLNVQTDQPVNTSPRHMALSQNRSQFAHVAAAAICTEDLATISFKEYTVDWQPWLKEVASNWSQAVNSKNASKHKPAGPMFVEFTCRRDGSVSEVIIDRSSGDISLDALQINALIHCMPLPAFPAQSRKQTISLLCIWAYSNHTNVATKATRHVDRPVIRVSVSGDGM